MSAQTSLFVRSMVERFPGLATHLDAHLEDNYGEVLPHLFFGDVTRYVLSLLQRTADGGLPARRELRDILNYLEQAFSEGDEELKELISVSFLENLPSPGDPYAQMRDLLGPALKKELSIKLNWHEP